MPKSKLPRRISRTFASLKCQTILLKPLALLERNIVCLENIDTAQKFQEPLLFNVTKSTRPHN